ncbi:MAG: hypothetical protein HC852_16050 [Acaryochloridaceae cyanobacterium RU_4_10]|nr:hypothetical protein [Acaryochloridaceae cyanobacterium RU_4_10]
MQYYRRKPLNLAQNYGSVLGDAVDLEMLPDPSAAIAPLMPDPASLIQSAASILDEEMELGAIAAKALPQYGVNPTTYGQAESLSANGLLKDAHQFLDRFAEVITQMSQSMGYDLSLSQAECESVPILRSRQSVRAGEVGTLTFKLHNDSETAASFTLHCTDLLSGSGGRISSQAVEFTPQNIQLEKDALLEVTLRFRVPAESIPGTYSGLLIASQLSYLKAVIVVIVQDPRIV